MRFPCPPTLACTGRKLMFQRRLVTLWAWLMRFPACGFLPQISHCCAIGLLLPDNSDLVGETLILQEMSGFGNVLAGGDGDSEGRSLHRPRFDFRHSWDGCGLLVIDRNPVPTVER